MKKSQNIDYQYNRLISVLHEGYTHLRRILITETGNGEYWLFGKYTLSKSGSSYTITDNNDRQIKFGSLRHAVTWATLDNLMRFAEANRVRYLDAVLNSSELEGKIAQRLLKTSITIDAWGIASNKQAQCTDRFNKNQAEMNKYIMIARHWQIRELENATKRNEEKSNTIRTSRSKRAL